MAKDKVMDEYIPIDPLAFLSGMEEKEETREVLYTFGEQELIRDDGKYYLSHTIYPNVSKEITKETATEMWQSFNMKERGDISFLI